MKKILITGGSGFVGEHIIRLAKDKYFVHAIYHTNAIYSDRISTYQFDLSQVSEIEQLLYKINPDAIIHTAAISNPNVCEQDQENAVLVNVQATKAVAAWAAKNKARFIFTSTDMVFDGKKGYYRESDKPNPISVYSQTKVDAEKLIANNNSNYAIARVALVYGIGISRKTSFFEEMLENLKQENSVTLFHDQFRTPILVNNLAEALLELVENEFNGIIHLGGGERISRWDFGLKTCLIFNLPSRKMIKASMFDFATAAFRPRDISLINDLAKSVLRVKLLNCDEGLERIKKDNKLFVQ